MYNEMKIKDMVNEINETHDYNTCVDISNKLYDMVTRLISNVDDDLEYNTILTQLATALYDDIENFKNSDDFKLRLKAI